MKFLITVDGEDLRCSSCNRTLDTEDWTDIKCQCGVTGKMVDGVLQMMHPAKGAIPLFLSLAVTVAESVPEGTRRAVYGGAPEHTYLIEKDGNSWCAHNALFKSLAESPASFGDTAPEALLRLLGEEEVEAEHNRLDSLEASKGCPTCIHTERPCPRFIRSIEYCPDFETEEQEVGNG